MNKLTTILLLLFILCATVCQSQTITVGNLILQTSTNQTTYYASGTPGFVGNGSGLNNLNHDVLIAGSAIVQITSVTNPVTGQITNTVIVSTTGGGATNAIPVFNIVNYGAIADDQTEDSNALVSAIAAATTAGGGEVYVPNGSNMFKISGNYFVPPYVTFMGANRSGATLDVSPQGTNAFLTFTNGPNTLSSFVANLGFHNNTTTNGFISIINPCTWIYNCQFAGATPTYYDVLFGSLYTNILFQAYVSGIRDSWLDGAYNDIMETRAVNCVVINASMVKSPITLLRWAIRQLRFTSTAREASTSPETGLTTQLSTLIVRSTRIQTLTQTQTLGTGYLFIPQTRLLITLLILVQAGVISSVETRTMSRMGCNSLIKLASGPLFICKQISEPERIQLWIRTGT